MESRRTDSRDYYSYWFSGNACKTVSPIKLALGSWDKGSLLRAVIFIHSLCSSILFNISLLLLLSALLLILFVLHYSFIIDDWPFRSRNDWPMLHGPWHYIWGFRPNPRRDALEYVFMLIPLAAELSFLSLIISPGKRTLSLFILCFAAIFITFHQLYWLID